MRRLGLATLLAALVSALPAGGAAASRLLTWTTSSEFVDPARVQFNGPPPGGPELAPALRVNLLLPDGFTRRRRYPVLYLLHGHGDRFDSWANSELGDVAGVARGFPGIIVMPEGARGWYANWWQGGRRGDPAWERYHLDELVPLVSRRLPIRTGRRWHAIAGLSMGGEGAMFYASQRPGYFGSVAAFSAPLSLQRPEWPLAFDSQGESHREVFGDPFGQRFYWSGHNPAALSANLRHTRVFVAVGDGVADPAVPAETANYFGQLAEAELRQHAEDFVAAARDDGVKVVYRPLPGIHDWRYWRQHLRAALAWGFFDPVPQAPGAWEFRTVATSGEAWGLRFRFSPPATTVQRLSLAKGRSLRGAGSGKAILTTPSGCRFVVSMGRPWTARLPAGWRRPARTRAQRLRGRRACRRTLRISPARPASGRVAAGARLAGRPHASPAR